MYALSLPITLANALTTFRLIMSPVFIAVFFWDSALSAPLSLAIVLMSEGSDVLDGYLARSRGQVTSFGKIFDPLADSISRFTIFLCYLAAHLAPLWMVATILYRDMLVSTLRTAAASQGVIISARKSGKVKAVVQGTSIIAIQTLLTQENRDVVSNYVHSFMMVVALVTAWSAIDYVWGNRNVLAKIRK
ncbi:MAG: CDP-diacylglycerol--glycerol-3-phosphate 3-phosphatidyltransferase [Candidatus Latescibacteria bacterium]|nr:CDP-diacylglycerol--glycerol-3-phosphate 3-phosphatidyltransferase [Candidatus Latescibacterota bacterium]